MLGFLVSSLEAGNARKKKEVDCMRNVSGEKKALVVMFSGKLECDLGQQKDKGGGESVVHKI